MALAAALNSTKVFARLMLLDVEWPHDFQIMFVIEISGNIERVMVTNLRH
jgi:hypothetical protein